MTGHAFDTHRLHSFWRTRRNQADVDEVDERLKCPIGHRPYHTVRPMLIATSISAHELAHTAVSNVHTSSTTNPTTFGGMRQRKGLSVMHACVRCTEILMMMMDSLACVQPHV